MHRFLQGEVNSVKKLDNYSVIMSVYSKVKPEDLKISIDSILNQTYKTNEFIIIKDGLLTKEEEIIINNFYEENKSIIKVIELKENKGAGYAYNKGLEICSNKWAAIMDSDDYADPTKFEKQMKFLSEHEEIDVVGTNAVEFIDDINNIVSTRKKKKKNEEIVNFAHGRCPIIQPTAIFKVKSVVDAGSYQHSPLTEDYDLYIRMIMNGCVFYTYQEILYYVRTSKDFFKRRGGIKYLKPILSFKLKYFKKGFFSLKQFIKTACSSIIVSIMPNTVRTMIYKKFLRN